MSEHDEHITELEKLKNQLDKKKITKKEYNIKKSEIIDSMLETSNEANLVETRTKEALEKNKSQLSKKAIIGIVALIIVFASGAYSFVSGTNPLSLFFDMSNPDAEAMNPPIPNENEIVGYIDYKYDEKGRQISKKEYRNGELKKAIEKRYSGNTVVTRDYYIDEVATRTNYIEKVVVLSFIVEKTKGSNVEKKIEYDQFDPVSFPKYSYKELKKKFGFDIDRVASDERFAKGETNYKYDSNGSCIESVETHEQKDEEGRTRIWKKTRKYFKDILVLERMENGDNQSYFSEDEERYVISCDAKGNIIESLKYLGPINDENNQILDSCKEYEYKGDKLSVINLFDSDGELMKTEEYDEHGNVIYQKDFFKVKQYYYDYDKDGNVVKCTSDSDASKLFTYTKKGHKVFAKQLSKYDENETLCWIVFKYDKKGNLIKEIFGGENGYALDRIDLPNREL